MPCSTRKARLLLKGGKAVIVKYNPFTIQLKYATGEAKQPCNIGIDTGSKNVGFAITSENKVFYKGVIELRQDITSLIYARRVLRINRRFRKTRYRQPRYLNRVHNRKLWLPPTHKSKVNSIYKWINIFENLIPEPSVNIEVAKFNTEKLIRDESLKKSVSLVNDGSYLNKKYYIFARDNYTCQCCGKRDVRFQIHHIVFRNLGGTDSVDNLITLCENCHSPKNHQPGNILHKWCKERKKVKQYKEPPFMNSLRVVLKTNLTSNTKLTYGYETEQKRKKLDLPKTHYNDAIAISGIEEIKENPKEWVLIKQFRKKKRSLHEANAIRGRKAPNINQQRKCKNVKMYKGFYLGDKVKVGSDVGYVYGFATRAAYIKKSDGSYIYEEGKNYPQVLITKLLYKNHSNGWIQYIQTA